MNNTYSFSCEYETEIASRIFSHIPCKVTADRIILCSADIRTFEILLRTYEVRDGALKSGTADEEAAVGPLPQKRRKFTASGENTGYARSNSSILVRPCSTAKGHTGYLTFARLRLSNSETES